MKITCKIWDPLLAAVNKKFNKSCLRRDACVDIWFKHEAALLLEELPQAASSNERKHIERSLGELKRTPVSLNLSADTVTQIDNACKSRNVVRDSFINRLFLFLLLPGDAFSRLLGIDVREYFPRLLDEGEFLNDAADLMLKGGLNSIHAMVQKDPFWAIRECIRIARRDLGDDCALLHAAYIPPDFLEEDINLAGLNCTVEQWLTEEPSRFNKSRSGLEDLLAKYDSRPSHEMRIQKSVKGD